MARAENFSADSLAQTPCWPLACRRGGLPCRVWRWASHRRCHRPSSTLAQYVGRGARTRWLGNGIHLGTRLKRKFTDGSDFMKSGKQQLARRRWQLGGVMA
ncbi:hypothetical protein NPIL_607641 [Nephila pilipes]|uniref:Uncharacterized protein n=1 Tax=Nephila pilipes TaxID=299642 RepID=A0A8X6PZJ0_NEPPI|nr:hypothetical protein NPIL_607641 [Nephila pilipes]